MDYQPLFNEIKKEADALIAENRFLEAVPLLKQLGNWGDLESQKDLVQLYKEGLVDAKEAYGYARLAAFNQDPKSMVDFALMNRDGIGCAKNNEKAFYYLHKAANMGYEEAYDLLAMMYLMGTGITRDVNEAKKWNDRANKSNDEALRHQKMIAQMLKKIKN